MKTQPRQHISNKYNTCTVVTSPVYIGSKILHKFQIFRREERHRSILQYISSKLFRNEGRHFFFSLLYYCRAPKNPLTSTLQGKQYLRALLN